MSKRTAWLSSLLIWGLYAIALLLPVAGDPQTIIWVKGWQALCLGWQWPGIIAELANLTLLVGWIALMRRNAKFAAVTGTLGVLFALSAPVLFGVTDILRVGYFLWLASNICLPGLAFWHLRRKTPAKLTVHGTTQVV